MLVENSATKTQSLAIKSLVVKDEKQQIVYGEVYSPMRLDTDSETMTAEDISLLERRFMDDHLTNKIDIEHDKIESGCEVIRSFIAMKNDPDGYVQGAWVLGVKVHPAPVWDMVMKGELNGFSFSGSIDRIAAEAIVQMIAVAHGDTEKSEDGMLPPHVHKCAIAYNDNGQPASNQFTEFELEHRHPIILSTATEVEMEHGHRLVLIEN